MSEQRTENARRCEGLAPFCCGNPECPAHDGAPLVETLESVIASLRARLDAVVALSNDRAFIHGGPTRTREALLAALNGYTPSRGDRA